MESIIKIFFNFSELKPPLLVITQRSLDLNQLFVVKFMITYQNHNGEFYMNRVLWFLSVLLLLVQGVSADGKKVFETYCWGCHHQSAMAFGPPFEEIASKRSAEEIAAMITDPAGVSKVFGYKRNAMPPFKLTPLELKEITAYILSYKPKGKK